MLISLRNMVKRISKLEAKVKSLENKECVCDCNKIKTEETSVVIDSKETVSELYHDEGNGDVDENFTVTNSIEEV